jgi:hypothetical protein
MDNGWGDSMVSTKYMYQRVHAILEFEGDDMAYLLSRLMEELAANYRLDTGNFIGGLNESND